MDSARRAETEPNGRSHALSLQEFCDMRQLYKLIENWAKSTGMSAVIIDTQGRRTSESFGMTEFCQMIHDSENGLSCCASTWQAERDGVYVCPLGFCDFSIPIVLPDGQRLGRVLAGQALADNQDVQEVLRRTVRLGLDEKRVQDVLSRVRRKTSSEMESAFQLLSDILHFFIEKNYAIWKTDNELKAAPAKKDRVLSQITQRMYSYNLTIDLETGTYALITGTGMERTVAEYKRHSRQDELRDFHARILHPAYADRFNALLDFSAVRDSEDYGFRGSLEYPVLYPGEEKYEWH